MASVSYQKIFKLVLGSIKDHSLASLNEEDANTLMTEYLHEALSEPYLNDIFSSSTLDDNAQTFTYVLEQTTKKDESDFVANAIAKWMVYAWHAKNVNNTALTEQMIFSSKEKSFFSQQAHLSTNMSLKDSLYKEARQYVMDRGFGHNSYLGG